MSKKAIFYISFFVLLSVGFMGFAGLMIKEGTGEFFGKEKLPVLGVPATLCRASNSLTRMEKPSRRTM
jgi:hypothetical protein